MRLQQRLLFLLLLPLAGLLTAVGVSGYLFSQQLILKQWQEGAILKLQWAAHHIDMRLQRPINWMEIFQTTGDLSQGAEVQAWIIGQIEALGGVVDVTIDWKIEGSRPEEMGRRGRMSRSDRSQSPRKQMGMMRFHRASIARVTPPSFDTGVGEKTVTVVSDFQDEEENHLGSMEVDILFSYLLQNILELGWWQTERAYLVNDQGRILTRSGRDKINSEQLGADAGIEDRVLEEMQQKDFGTLQGADHLPDASEGVHSFVHDLLPEHLPALIDRDKVGGFYKLEHAPWSLILLAPGQKVLAPLLRFRNLYLIAGVVCILIIVLFIRLVTGRVVNRIKRVSRAAESVSKGDYGEPLSEKGPRDEILLLTRSFNNMVQGLRERDFIRNTFGRYVDQEIAEELMARPESAKLGGARREVSMLMSDLRGFTPLAESLRPEETVSLLNSYFDRMIQVILKHKGIIVDFFGDALLVFFDPLDGPVKPSVQRSLGCAIEMQQELQRFNEQDRAETFPELRMGIGLHTGEVVVGNIGSEERAKYGIVGSSVNMTSRIQGVAGEGEVLVSEASYAYAPEGIKAGPPRVIRLKGIPGTIRLYPLESKQLPF